MTERLCAYEECSAPLVRREKEREERFLDRKCCSIRCARRRQAYLGLNGHTLPNERQEWWKPIAPPPFPHVFTDEGGYILPRRPSS
jgi:hypothetical protein